MKVHKKNNKVIPVPKKEYSNGAIGIDLGATYSCVGVWQNGGVKIVPNNKGNGTTPSCVSFTNGDPLVGDSAKARMGSHPTSTVYGVKRLIGRKYSDPVVGLYKRFWPFKVVNHQSKPMIIAVTYNDEEVQFSAEDISAMVLKKLKENAESYLGSKVTSAVITVPADFNVSQRQATKSAGELAGLEGIRLINEPVAAAVAYAFNRKKQDIRLSGHTVVVFDFGGDCLDVSMVSICSNKFEVMATKGEACIGGDDIDKGLLEHFMEVFRRKHGKNMSQNARAVARLRAACERAKRVLSWALVTTIEIDCLFENTDFYSLVSRRLLEKLSMNVFKRSIDCVAKCMEKSCTELNDVNSVILVGGSSKIPKVQQMLQDYFKDVKLFKDINPDEVVAYGATIISEMLATKRNAIRSEVVDLVPTSLGIEVYGEKMSVMVSKNASLPIEVSKVYTTVFDNQKAAKFAVYEGEKYMIKDNNFLGKFILTDLPKAPAKEPKFDVTFTMNSSGILTMSSKLRGTINRKEIALASSESTSHVIQLERMVADAKRNKSEDVSYDVVKVNMFNHSLKVYASVTLKCIRKKLKQIRFLNCFDIRD
ncbi:heat shock 70 kDa protein-like [Chenopodium quinoa]|uniref:heat shock 70 kDa protein-like n=1 Tax=Chenopodium quinoa TaxID=63459 RepID=UPI000B76F3C5|nr:heat shock 70 kDa protein-like [Chenopodium quinoa]XP_021723392.1 heat shock 70 kDa protein-like [Chenopodium quinoa]